jgi:hypothetical protein
LDPHTHLLHSKIQPWDFLINNSFCGQIVTILQHASRLHSSS